MINFTSALWTSEKFIEDTEKQIEKNSLTKYGTYKIIDHAWYDPLKVWTEKKTKEITLTSNTDQCLINCKAEGTTTLYSKGTLFDKLDLYNIKGEKENYEIKVYYKDIETYDVEIPIYEEVCDGKVSVNGTQVCNQVQTDTKTETREKEVWIEYKFVDLDAGTYEWKIEAKKDKNKDIDWIGSVGGIELKNWAWWDSDWGYKKKINITGAVLVNQSVLIPVTINENMNANGNDLRFIDSTETTEIPFVIQNISSTLINVWVKTQSNDSIYMYY
jgi:hypothetical protein